MWSLGVAVLLGGLCLFGVVIGGRLMEARTWRSRLAAYRLVLPSDLTADDVARWLTHVSGITHPPQWSLLPLPPVGLELVAARGTITHYLLVSRTNETHILSGLRSSLPGIRIEDAPDYLAARPAYTVAAELGMTNHARPLAIDRAEAINAALLSSLLPLVGDEQIRIQ